MTAGIRVQGRFTCVNFYLRYQRIKEQVPKDSQESQGEKEYQKFLEMLSTPRLGMHTLTH